MNNYPDNDYRDYLEHRLFGSKNKGSHKYLFIKNGRYYYPSDIAEGAKSLARGVKARLTPSYYSAANRERRAYRKTGMTKQERTLAKARNDIGKIWAKNRKKEETGGMKAVIGGAKTRLRTGIASLSSKNRERNAYKRTGLTKAERSAQRKERLTGIANSLRNKVTGVALRGSQKVRTGVASLSSKNRERIAYRNTGFTKEQRDAQKKQKKTQRERQAYRDTGIKNKTLAGAVYSAKQAGRSAKNTASSAKNWATDYINSWKKGGSRRRNAYRKTGWKALK